MAEKKDDKKVIYSMINVSKIYDKKAVLKDIYLSYFYGAKIGVLGLNGSGKSSLLRILAGLDTDFRGETVLSPGYTVGLLEQEPKLDESKTVRQVAEEGLPEAIAAIKEYNDISDKLAEPMDDAKMNALIDRQSKVQEKIDALNAWDVDSRLELAMDALGCPPPDTLISPSPDCQPTLTDTSPDGWLLSFTWKVAVPPSGTDTASLSVTNASVSLSDSFAATSLGV